MYLRRCHRVKEGKRHAYWALVKSVRKGKRFRGVETLLRNVHWCKHIGMRRVLDHNTLCRAHKQLVKPGVVEKMLDLSVQTARKLQRRNKKKKSPKPA